MCGIVGCLNKCNCNNNSTQTQSPLDVVSHSLHMLQNRGNDSYGLGQLSSRGTLDIRKQSNLDKLPFYELMGESIRQLSEIDSDKYSDLVLGHCRWATHGANTDINAHPHLDFSKTMMIVHNGTIENFRELRQFLESKGITNQSDTDTEIIINLISYYFGIGAVNVSATDLNLRMVEAIRQTTLQLKGIWACIVVATATPEHLYAFRSFCPLLVGWDREECEITLVSERSGLPKTVQYYAKLVEGQIYSFGVQSDLTALFQGTIHEVTEPIDELSDPSPFKHWMLREIYEQRDTLDCLLSKRIRIDHPHNICQKPELNFPELELYLKIFVTVDHLYLVGCGTSHYASKYASHFLVDTGLFTTVQCVDASEFSEEHLAINRRPGFIFFSQSGETMDLIRVQQLINSRGWFNLAIVNVNGSTIASNATVALNIEAGREVAVASTKSYSGQILLIRLLALWLDQRLNVKVEKAISSLHTISTMIGQVLDESSGTVKRWAERLVSSQRLFILGKHSGYSLARESALKLKEIAYLHAEAYSSSALKHGPYSLIEIGSPIIFIINRDNTNDQIVNTVSEVRSRGAVVWVVTDLEPELAKDLGDDHIILPYNSELYGILVVTVFQLLAYHMALVKGHNPDFPRNLAKSVTVD